MQVNDIKDIEFSTTKIDEDFINTILNNNPEAKELKIFVNPKKYAEIPDLLELSDELLNYTKKWAIYGNDIKFFLIRSDKVPYKQIRCVVIKDDE